jgi:hypothetical protein
MRKFRNGDLVKSELTKVYPEEKDWYGIVIGCSENMPQAYPILSTKYHIRWHTGSTSWMFSNQLKIVSRVRS